MQGGRLGDPSKMAAAQYVSKNRQRQSMRRLRILCLCVKLSDPGLQAPPTQYTHDNTGCSFADRGGAVPGAGLHVSPRLQCFSLVSGKVMTSTQR